MAMRSGVAGRPRDCTENCTETRERKSADRIEVPAGLSRFEVAPAIDKVNYLFTGEIGPAPASPLSLEIFRKLNGS